MPVGAGDAEGGTMTLSDLCRRYRYGIIYRINDPLRNESVDLHDDRLAVAVWTEITKDFKQVNTDAAWVRM